MFQTEPLPKDSLLWDMPNVLLSPHSADRTATFQVSNQRVQPLSWVLTCDLPDVLVLPHSADHTAVSQVSHHSCQCKFPLMTALSLHFSSWCLVLHMSLEAVQCSLHALSKCVWGCAA